MSIAYRLTVLAVLLGILEWDRSVTCIFLLWEYIVGYVALFVACIAVEFSICFLATRGSILDTTARAPMQYILYIRLCKFLHADTYRRYTYIFIFVIFTTRNWSCDWNGTAKINNNEYGIILYSHKLNKYVLDIKQDKSMKIPLRSPIFARISFICIFFFFILFGRSRFLVECIALLKIDIVPVCL